MTTTEAILNHASMKREGFTRKDLLLDIENQQTNISKRAVDLQINRLIPAGVLCRKGRGMYQLKETRLPDFFYRPSEIEENIFLHLRKAFPFLDMCIWSPQVLALFMHHVPNIDYTFIDVEKDGMESVFHTLQSMNLKRNILLNPSLIDCERYLQGTDAIVVRQLIKQSPLTEVDGCTIPRIEKILVDALHDNELFFAGESEIYNIYEYARERNHINMSKLLRYASRRNRKTEVEQILHTIDHDQSKK